MTDSTEQNRPTPSAAAGNTVGPAADGLSVAGVDGYTFLTRVLPGLLATAPLLALGALALPYLDGAAQLWGICSVGVTTYGALIARNAGNRVQDELYEAWGGAPTTHRLRFASDVSDAEITRRHARLEWILGDLVLPTAAEESVDPPAADQHYTDAVRRLRAYLKRNPVPGLMSVENRNYGFARNLLGLKPLGVAFAWTGLALSLLVAIAVGLLQSFAAAAATGLPGLVAVVCLLGWRFVDPDFVRPSAEAYADRLIDVLDGLARE